MDLRFYDLKQLFRYRDVLAPLDPAAPPVLRLVAPETVDPVPRRLGVLPGSFNPLTIAHVALADAARREGVEPVLFVLSRLTVDKERVTGTALEDRLLVLDLHARQAERSGPAGTWIGITNRGLYVDQAEAVRRALPSLRDLVFLVGFDKIVQIFDPRYYADRNAALRRLFALATFLVAPRGGGGPEELEELLDRPENRPFRGRVQGLWLPDELRDVAASDVRAAIAAGRPWPAELPPVAIAFIRETGAYAPPRRLPSGEEVDDYGLRLQILELLDRSHPWAEIGADFAALVRLARRDTPAGRELRAFLRRPPEGDVTAALRDFQRKAGADTSAEC